MASCFHKELQAKAWHRTAWGGLLLSAPVRNSAFPTGAVTQSHQAPQCHFSLAPSDRTPLHQHHVQVYGFPLILFQNPKNTPTKTTLQQKELVSKSPHFPTTTQEAPSPAVTPAQPTLAELGSTHLWVKADACAKLNSGNLFKEEESKRGDRSRVHHNPCGFSELELWLQQLC